LATSTEGVQSWWHTSSAAFSSARIQSQKDLEVRGIRKNLKDLKYKVSIWIIAGFSIPVSSFTHLRSSVTCALAAAAKCQ
jgi:hypothetical protein